jgi:hypothetical protein
MGSFTNGHENINALNNPFAFPSTFKFRMVEKLGWCMIWSQKHFSGTHSVIWRFGDGLGNRFRKMRTASSRDSSGGGMVRVDLKHGFRMYRSRPSNWSSIPPEQGDIRADSVAVVYLVKEEPGENTVESVPVTSSTIIDNEVCAMGGIVKCDRVYARLDGLSVMVTF